MSEIIDAIYPIEKKIGEGLTSDVFLVESGSDKVALKLLKQTSDLSHADTLIEAFKYEFALLKQLTHPNIASLYDFGFDTNCQRFYFTQEYLDGADLRTYAQGKTVNEIKELFIQCLQGLSFIHEQGILHGDFKPTNIFVVKSEAGPVVKIIDFGLAHPDLQGSAGTPAYFAPEKILKNKPTFAADLYSLGVVFYELLTESNPFAKGKLQECFKAHVEQTAKPPALLNDKIPPLLNDTIVSLLNKNPHERKTSSEILTLFGAGTRAFSLGKKWIGREQTRQELLQWAQSQQPGIGVVVGAAGVGKSLLLEEVKYSLQLLGVAAQDYLDEWTEKKVLVCNDLLFLAHKPQDKPVVTILCEANIDELEEIKKLAQLPVKEFNLDFFTKEDLAKLVQETAQQNPPAALIESLFAETKGHPGYSIQLLHALADKHGLISEQGEWNLAPFKEGLADFNVQDQEIEFLDQALASKKEDLLQLATLLLQKTAKLIHKDKLTEAQQSLSEAKKSLESLPQGEERKKLRVSWYEKTGWLNLKLNKLADAKKSLDRALALLEESVSDAVSKLRIENFLARLQAQEGQVDAAIKEFLRTRKQAEQLSQNEKLQVSNNDLGYAYFLAQDYKNAASVFAEDLKDFKKRNDKISQARLLYNLGACYEAIADHSAALKHYQKLATLAREIKLFPFLLRAYNGLGNTHLILGDSTKSIEFYGRALDLSLYLRDGLSAATISQNRGALLKEMGESAKALKDLEVSLNELEKLSKEDAHVQYLEARALVETAEIYRLEKKYEHCGKLIDRALRLTENAGAPKTFRYYVLESATRLALDKNNQDDFLKKISHLSFEAKTEEQKQATEVLKKRGETMFDKVSGQKTTPLPKAERTMLAMDPLLRLLETSKILVTEKNVKSLLGQVLRHACDLSKAESGLILLSNEEGDFAVEASLNLTLDQELDQVSKSIAEKVLSSGQALLTNNAQEDPEFNQYASVVHLNLKSIFCLPIKFLGKVLGVLYLTHRYQQGIFNEETRDILHAFADQAGVALENANLFVELAQKNKELKEALKKTREERDHYKFLAENSEDESFGKVIGVSAAMQKLYSVVKRVADTPLSVLILGESGTGKEMLAREIHKNSSRSLSPFVAINCAALPENLIESELFGHKAGAFTGATRDKKGLFEEAHGGTVFLDEIGELKPELQAKLLRVLQEGEITRIGENMPRKISVRVLAATLVNIESAMKAGKFREDLYFRLKELELIIPPLRERRQDIPLLVKAFIEKYCDEMKIRKKPKISQELMEGFINHSWPGNVRELENRVRVACALSDGKMLQLEDLPDSDRNALQSAASTSSSPTAASSSEKACVEKKKVPPTNLDEFLSPVKKWKEIELVVMAKALQHFDFDVADTAQALDVAAATLYNRLRKHQIRENVDQWNQYSYIYTGDRLDNLQREVFNKVLEDKEGKPYHAARALGVTPATFYKWVD